MMTIVTVNGIKEMMRRKISKTRLKGRKMMTIIAENCVKKVMKKMMLKMKSQPNHMIWGTLFVNWMEVSHLTVLLQPQINLLIVPGLE